LFDGRIREAQKLKNPDPVPDPDPEQSKKRTQWMEKNLNPRSGMNIPDHFSDS
jgi:hypothetical protein